jgi:hypothetical protein
MTQWDRLPNVVTGIADRTIPQAPAILSKPFIPTIPIATAQGEPATPRRDSDVSNFDTLPPLLATLKRLYETRYICPEKMVPASDKSDMYVYSLGCYQN